MKKFLFMVCLAIILFAIVDYLQKTGQLPPPSKIAQVISPTISVGSSSAVLGENVDSLCHAIHVDASDAQAYLPDPNCTPGVIDPAVTQDNLSETICKSGYTTTVRPSVSYTNKLKAQQMHEYGYTDTNMKDYEEDHFISLELGGSPDDPKNLWPEPHGSWNEKDSVEGYLHKQVCSGAMTLSEAQNEITKNWYEVYLKIK